jgi:hypothetical protein
MIFLIDGAECDETRRSACCLFLAFAGSASAQDRSSQRASCLDDYKKFCQHVPRGKGAIKQCLLSQSDKLSSACKTVLEKTAHEKS